MPAPKARPGPAPKSQPEKVVLITGAARRLGREIALALARDGWSIGVHYRRSKADAEALAAEIETLGVRSAAFPADLSDLAAVKRLVPECAGRLGAPLCLVNNASEFLLDTLDTLDEKTWDTHLDINLKAPVFLAQAMLKSLPKGVEGNIINIIDQRVWKLTPDFFSYTISKAGLWTATRTLAQALARACASTPSAPAPCSQSMHQTQADFARRAIVDTARSADPRRTRSRPPSASSLRPPR